MPDLIHSLYKQDIGFLRIIASFWGLELIASDTNAAADELAAAMLDPQVILEMVDSLPTEAHIALTTLIAAGGRIPWAAFTRQHGELRDAGHGRRDREQYFLHPVSATELLYYRGLLARDFFETPAGVQEFAHLPSDLLTRIQPSQARADPLPASVHESGNDIHEEPPGRLATPQERAHPLPACDCLLDDAVTLLAALRLGVDPRGMHLSVPVVSEFLRAAKILAGSEPEADAVKAFLEMPRDSALSVLAEAWRNSQVFNEMRQVPGLACEGEWQNKPLETRRFLLTQLEKIPVGKWWSLAALVRAVKEQAPDYQRPSGDYDSWFIKRLDDGAYLRGFETWDAVDGELIRYLITGPSHWLGLVNLASSGDNDSCTAFQVVKQPGVRTENGKLSVSSTGMISVPRNVPRLVRYLVARFCEWEDPKAGEYRYLVTTDALKRASQQGLRVSQLLSLLARNTRAEVPPAFVKALKRWEQKGTEARIEVQTILRVNSPEVLAGLRRSKAGRFLGENLGPVSVTIKPGARPKVLAALAELGLLAECIHDTDREQKDI